MSTAMEIGIALAAFVGILAAKRRDWITFAVSLLAMLIVAGLTIRNTRERKHLTIATLAKQSARISTPLVGTAKH